MVDSITTTFGGGNSEKVYYIYGDTGNIDRVESLQNGVRYYDNTYKYDDLGQLIRENNRSAGKTYVFTYDNAGNITSKKTYAYTTADTITTSLLDTVIYEYNDPSCGDLLTKYDGHSIAYDSCLNPVTYYAGGETYTMTWTRGRRLSSMSSGSQTLSFTYNDEGIRTSKTVNGTKHTYSLSGSQILSEEWYTGTTQHLILYVYDANGSPIGMRYRNSTYSGAWLDSYLFVKNLQGDIIYIYDEDGNRIVTYSYDAWGNIISITGSAASTIGVMNPFRYRGYYYDEETGLYYVSSRYYDPEIGRWINADSYISTGNGVLEKNMFAYCLNNPVNMVDPSGEIAITTLILIGSIVAGVAVSGYTAYTSHKYTGKVDWNNTILSGLSTFAFCYTYGMSAYGMYVSYCDYKGYTPVTNIGSAPKTNPAPYSNLQDPSNVAPGKDFTASQKAQIIQQNKINNNGVVKSDLSGQTLVPPQKSMKGVTPPANEWQIDHIIPKSAGGTNSFSNAQVLSREENRIKWDH